MLPILRLFPIRSATRSPVLSGRLHLLVDGIRPEAQAEHDPQQEAPMAEQMTVVLGERRYVVERHWGVTPASVTLGLPSQVAVDKADRVHLYQRHGPAVLVFEPDGRFAYTYGEAVADPHGIYRDPADRMFLVDRDAHQVIVTTPDGKELLRLGERHRPRWGAPFNHPTDAAVDAEGRIYVSDGYGNAMVHRFSADGRHELSWGRLGRGPGQFMTPHAVWVDRRGRVLVGDRENGRIQLFTAEGAFLLSWDGFENPMDIWIDPATDLIYVTDQVPSLHLLSGDGERLGRCRPSLNGAHGIFGDSRGNIFISEMNPPSLTKLRLLP